MGHFAKVRTGAAAALLVASSAAAALAADLPVRMPVKAPPAVAAPAASWAGAYVGGFVGYGWGDAKATAPFDDATGFFYNFNGASYVADVDGFFGGGTVGYNLQAGALVFGVEGELGYLGLKGSAIEPNDLPNTNDTVTRFKSGLYGAIYGRLGATAGNALLYAKGGAAFLDAKASTIDPCVAPPATCGTTTLTMTGEDVMVGWSAGAGIEWALSPQWGVKAEYAYFDFGKIRTSGPSSTPGELYGQTIAVTAHTAKLGVNYRFAPGLAGTRP
jgi:outer membrane immunogenic protein